MALRIYGVAIALLRKLRPVMERVKAKDDNLADQLYVLAPPRLDRSSRACSDDLVLPASAASHPRRALERHVMSARAPPSRPRGAIVRRTHTLSQDAPRPSSHHQISADPPPDW